MWVAALVSMVVAGFCLGLPHTPPLASRRNGLKLLCEGLNLARQHDVNVLLTTSFGVYLTVPMVYQVIPGYLEWRGLPRAWISTTMTLGQMTEIAMLAAFCPGCCGGWGSRGPGAGDLRVVPAVSQPGAGAAPVGGRGRDTAAWSRDCLFHRGWAGLY